MFRQRGSPRAGRAQALVLQSARSESWPVDAPPARRQSDRYLSLSRLNHGQPGVQAHPKIVQGTAELHHEIADALLPQPDPVFHNTTTLRTTVDMLHPQSAVVERLVGPLLLQGQLRTAWLLRRHEDRHLRERERQEAQILQQPTPSREGVGVVSAMRR